MQHVQAPQDYDGVQPSIFLAGGISGCELWQPRMAELLKPANLVVLDPRRENFSLNPQLAESQIRWEFRHLARATACLFWFPPQTLCPIALYELGKWSAGDRPLFVGVDPDYQRRQDVEIQTKLARPEVRVVYSLEDLAKQVVAHFRPAPIHNK